MGGKFLVNEVGVGVNTPLLSRMEREKKGEEGEVDRGD